MYENKPIAIVAVGAILPDAGDVTAFWQNILKSKVSIKEVPVQRWDPSLYFDTDLTVPDKTYSKIGSFVEAYDFEPLKWKIPIPPLVQKAMDLPQKWALATTRQALLDYGYPERSLNTDNTAVILGNALAGELHYTTTLRIRLPEFLQALESTRAFQNLSAEVQQSLINEATIEFQSGSLPVTEDTMPGELANVIAGRIANVFNLRGPNFVTDAACASSFAALQSAVEGLNAHHFDAAITGGIDSGMGVEAFVKFSKIGALSPDGSRPYDSGANGFVMGEGAAVFLLKRLEDAERDGDRIYAVIRGLGSSSDGSGKGITAPNPIGQKKAITRAWQNAGVDPASIGLIEGHGTSTRVGDVVEVNCLYDVFRECNLPVHSIALGSVKSNIGHLKSAAGAAGMLKAVLALHHKTLPPTANFSTPNPGINFVEMPFFVNTQVLPWETNPGDIRRAGVSAFGFGGTNFHLILEEYVPETTQGEHQLHQGAAVTAITPTNEVVLMEENIMLMESNSVETYILDIVSKKTGYPIEMLDLSLDLEADLGIDTVKQAELFSEVREHFDIPKIDDLRLSDYNTLERVIEFAQKYSSQETTEPVGAKDVIADPISETSAKISSEEIRAYILALISEKTGYPEDMLDLELDLEADLGIDTVKQAELFVNIREKYGIERRKDLRLSDYNTLEKVIQFVDENLSHAAGEEKSGSQVLEIRPEEGPDVQKPIRGLVFVGAGSKSELVDELQLVLADAEKGITPAREFPSNEAVKMPERVAIDFEDAKDLAKKAQKVLQAFTVDNDKIWFALAAQGIHYGCGNAGKVVYMFPGQGSQYVNMLRDLMDTVPVVVETYAEADAVLTPILGKPLTEFIFVDGGEEDHNRAKEALKNTVITQPAVLTCNVALLRMLDAYGYKPDMVVGHSLGEYAALVAAGILSFGDALKVVSARGLEMSKVTGDDNGCMAAVSAPIDKVQEIVENVSGYVVIANLNSPMQSVIGGMTQAVEEAIAAFTDAGYQAVKIPVSQAFHTKLVEPASEPLRKIIDGMEISSPNLPIVANVNGDWYPTTRQAILDNLAAQVYSPVQFVKCLETLYDAGGRVFIEVGPKRVMNVLASEILQDKKDVHISATNHPRKGGQVSFNESIACLLAAGIAPAGADQVEPPVQVSDAAVVSSHAPLPVQKADILTGPVNGLTGSVVISGTGLGLPGKEKKVFAEDNVDRLLKGEIMIEPLPEETREKMLEKGVIRLVKSEAGAQMVELDHLSQTVKLAGQAGAFDLAEEFGLPDARVSAYDISTQLAIAAGIDALREAGIPLVMAYKKTTVGTYIPDRWKLPPALADETGIIFASAFPGLSRMTDEMDSFYAYQGKQQELVNLQNLRQHIGDESDSALDFVQARINQLEKELADGEYHLDRKFIFRVLTMGHSQFAEYIGARGPNAHVNGACASTTQAVALAEDWIRAGRCRRVIVIAGDDVTGGSLANWIGTALMATGATTIEGDVRLAALPFDKRRNGMIMGMGAAALVVEAQDAVSERGMSGICEVLSSEFANSAFHGTRLEVDHVSNLMARLLSRAEDRFNLSRSEMASKMVFVSHETYTPARGGSASAEIHAIRHSFGDAANKVIIANTKGYTGHSMGVGIEDVLAVKALELGRVPPIAHFDEDFVPDLALGDLNLSKGGDYQPDYALRLGAGFGSQIAMTLYRRIPGIGSRTDPTTYQDWLKAVAGYQNAELEIEKRTLRVVDEGPPSVKPMESKWEFGQMPFGWAAIPGQAVAEPEIPHSEASYIDVIVPQNIESAPENQTEPPVQRLNVDPVKAFCLDLVSEKTGYPVEMLDLDLDLEADLGIDTVKQAELFAELREHYNLPKVEDLRLGDYNTLRKVIDFMSGMMGAKDRNDPSEGITADPLPVIEMDGGANPAIEKTPAGESQTEEQIGTFLLELVSEKTGYPVEMLEPELDLEADLGIDTVKQAELFATVREHYGIPRREDLVLSNYNTLEKVVEYVRESLTSNTDEPQVNEIPGQEIEILESETTLIRRVPVPVLRPKLSICKPTNVVLKPGDRVLVVSDGEQLGEVLAAKLRQLKVSVDQHNLKGDETLDEVYKGVFFINSRDSIENFESLEESSLLARLEASVFGLYRLIRNLDQKDLAFLMVSTHSGGLHGYDHSFDQITMTGAVSGFAKSLSREREGMLIKVVDFEASISPDLAAEKLIREVSHDPDIVEVGWRGDERFTIQALPMPRKPVDPISLGSETVFMVSGGGGGIIGPVVKDLASRTGGRFILFGRTAPASDEENPYLDRVLSDRKGFKQYLIGQTSKLKEKVSPAQIEKTINTLEKMAQIRQAITDIEKAGGSAEYIACNVTEAESVQNLVDYVYRTYGGVDVLIHAAGIEKSRLLNNKDEDEFRLVFNVKVLGFFHLYKAILAQGKPLKAVQVFSSVAGRFGNPGQTDYAAANDTLCRWLLAMRNQTPKTKFQTLDWSAWAEVGMAVRGFVPEAMARAGIDMLPVSVAAPQVYDELIYAASGEVVLAGSLGILEDHLMSTDGLDLERGNEALRSLKYPLGLFNNINASNILGEITLEGILDPLNARYLKDHALRGISVMPGVMGIEGFAMAAEHAASTLLTEGDYFTANRLTDIQFTMPLKFYRDEPRRVLWKVLVFHQDDKLIAKVSLHSILQSKLGETKRFEHFSANVYLTRDHLTRREGTHPVPEMLDRPIINSEDIYQLYFHGPVFQVLKGVQRQDKILLGLCKFGTTPESEDLLQLNTNPLLVESCFQTAGVWEIGGDGKFCLPQSVGSLRLYQHSPNGLPVYTCVRPHKADNGETSFDAWVIDEAGNIFLEMKEYRTSTLMEGLNDATRQPFKAVMEDDLE